MVGLQKPCACKPNTGTYPACKLYTYLIGPDSATATTQGSAEAIKAENTAVGLGTAAIIYKNLENYDPTSLLQSGASCGSVVDAYLSSWDKQLQTDHYFAGAYGNPTPAADWWAHVSPLPDDVWIAQYPASGKPPAVTIWALGLSYGMTDSMWPSNQRIHQYTNTHNETWAGATFGIDSDIVNAEIVSNNGAKTHNYVYASIDYPGAKQTWAVGINGMNGTGQIDAIGKIGTIVGYYHDSSNNEHGFKYANGTFSSIDYPGSPDTFALGINNSGQIVGGWCDSAGFCHGFLLSAGTFSQIDYPGGSTFTQANGINDAGQIVGSYHNSTGGNHGFLRYANQFYTIDDPNATQGTQAWAINGDGPVIGTFDSPVPTSFIEYALPPTWAGNFTSFNYPGAGGTTGYGIDNDNDMIGSYLDANFKWHGFQLTNNVVANTFQYPGVTSTGAEGINDFGQIVGWYQDSSSNSHGFMAIPQ